MMLGVVVGSLVAIPLTKYKKLNYYDYIIVTACTGGLGLMFAKILFIIQSYPLSEFFIQLIKVDSGYVFYGGLIGAIPGYIIGVKIAKCGLLDFADIYGCLIPLAHSFGRLGCFCAGCCYGIRYDGLFAIHYHNPLSSVAIDVGIFPVQLLEAVLLLMIFFITILLFYHYQYKMTCLVFYLISYSIIRFCVEFLRGDIERHFLRLPYFTLSTSQVISICIFTAVSSLYFIHFFVTRSNK